MYKALNTDKSAKYQNDTKEIYKYENDKVIIKLIALYIFVIVLAIIMTFVILIFHTFYKYNRYADYIIYNTKIWTGMEEDQISEHTALVIRDNKIIDLGADADMIRRYSKTANLIKLNISNMIVPGFVDSHVHMVLAGRILGGLYLEEVENISATVKNYSMKLRNGDWIFGGGWNEISCCGGVYPNKNCLDGIKNPIFLYHTDYHSALVNDITLMLANITKDSTNPGIGRDVNGELTGMLYESAMQLILNIIPFDDEKAMKLAENILLSNGITSVHDMGTLDKRRYTTDFYKKSKLRVYVSHPLQVPYIRRNITKSMFQAEQFHFFKGFMDGTIETHTSKLLANYADWNSTGSTLMTYDQLYTYCKFADSINADVAIHAIGDGTIKTTLDVFERIFKDNPRTRKWRIEHLELIDYEDIERMIKLNIIASMQPDHLTGSMPYISKYIGNERTNRLFLINSLSDNQILGTDFPIVQPNILKGIQQAALRIDESGHSFLEDERISVLDALKRYTVYGAKAMYMDNVLGIIQNGYVADLTVLDSNILTLKKTRIKDVKVLMTFIDGKLVYKR
jgi:predicted amidohydrolase YtcJ